MQNDSYLDAMLDARSMPTCALQLRQRSTYEQHHRNTSAAVPDITVADILIPRRCPSAPPALRPATLILPSPHNRMAQFTPLRSPSDGPSVRPPPMKHRRPHGHPTLTFLPTHHASDIDPIDDFPRPRRLFFQAAPRRHRPRGSVGRAAPSFQPVSVDQRAKVGRSGGRRGGRGGVRPLLQRSYGRSDPPLRSEGKIT